MIITHYRDILRAIDALPTAPTWAWGVSASAKALAKELGLGDLDRDAARRLYQSIVDDWDTLGWTRAEQLKGALMAARFLVPRDPSGRGRPTPLSSVYSYLIAQLDRYAEGALRSFDARGSTGQSWEEERG